MYLLLSFYPSEYIYIYIFFVNCEYYSDLNFTNHHPCKNFVFLPMNTICMFGDKGRLEKRHRCKTWWSIIDVLGLFCGSGVLSCILLNNRMSWWPLSRQKVTTQKCTCIQNNRYDCRRKKKYTLQPSSRSPTFFQSCALNWRR